MPDVLARLRLAGRDWPPLTSALLGESVTVEVLFNAPGGAVVDAAGITAYAYRPPLDGEATGATPSIALTRVSAGLWSGALALDRVGDWAIHAECAGPSAAVARADLRVTLGGPAALQDSRGAASAGGSASIALASRVAAEAARDSVLTRLAQQSVSALDFIPSGLHASIRAGTNTADLLPYLQLASDAAAAARVRLHFPFGFYRTFGELWVRSTSVSAEPGAVLIPMRDELAVIVATGDDITIQPPAIRPAWRTPDGLRKQRRTDQGYSGFPYNQGGLARGPFRDRNAGIFIINADRVRVVDPDIRDCNIGIFGGGRYVASNVQPAGGLSLDYNADGTWRSGPSDPKPAAAINWTDNLWNDGLTDIGYQYDLTILRPRTDGCDQGIFTQNQVRRRISRHVNRNTTYVQTSPPHAIYQGTTDAEAFPNLDCRIDGLDDDGNFWSSSIKMDRSDRDVVASVYSRTGQAVIFANDVDDSEFLDIKGDDLTAYTSTISGSWSSASRTLIVSSTDDLIVGGFLSSATPGLPNPAEIESIADGTTITLTAPTTAASGGIVLINVGTNSSSSCVIQMTGCMRNHLAGIRGYARTGEDEPLGIRLRDSNARLLVHAYRTTAAASAGATIVQFAAVGAVAAGWDVQLLSNWLPVGTTVSSVTDLGGGVVQVALSAALLLDLPSGTQIGFYRAINLTLTSAVAAGGTVLPVASTTGVLAGWVVSGGPFRRGTTITAVAANSITVSRPLLSLIGSGAVVAARSSRWAFNYGSDENTVVDAEISVSRSADGKNVDVFTNEGTNNQWINCRAVSRRPNVQAVYGFISGSPRRRLVSGNRIIDPSLRGLSRLFSNASPSCNAFVVTRNAQIFSGRDASFVKDETGHPLPTRTTIDGQLETVWTPVFVGSTIAGVNGYTTQIGRAFRHGNLVRVQAQLRLNGTFGSTGNIQIHGLPFTIRSSISIGCMPGNTTGFTLTAGEVVVLVGLANTRTMAVIRRGAAGEGNVTPSQMGASARLDFEFAYETSDPF